MGYVKLSCPACNAWIEHSGEQDHFFCEYCDTKIVIEKEVTKPLLQRAFLLLENRDYDNAESCLEQALEADPKCAKAYMGKLMCLLRVSQMASLSYHRVPLTTYADYEKALRFADDQEASQYLSYNQAIRERIADRQAEKRSEIRHLQQDVADIQQQITDGEKAFRKSTAKHILWVVLLSIAVLNALFWLIGVFVFPILLILFLPSAGLVALTFHFYNKTRKERAQYFQLQQSLLQAKIKVQKAEISYKEWLSQSENQ